jgi:hypothetical protein
VPDQGSPPGHPKGGTARARVVAAIGLGVAAVVFFVVSTAPDGGVETASLRQGSVLALLFAAPSLAVLAAPSNLQSVLALGGGMIVAGAALTPGGNPLGWPMAAVGFLLLAAAVGSRFVVGWLLLGRLFVTAAVLIAAFYLALPDSMLAFLGSLILINLVAISGRWQTSHQGLSSPSHR